MIKDILDYFYFIFEDLSYRLPYLASIYIKFHEYSVKKEIELLDLSSNEKILHIGCGAIPYTCIILSDYIRSKIEGIDNDQIIVEKSKRYIEKNGLTDLIQIKKGDGTTYDVSSYDIVILSYGIENHEQVLQNIINKIDKDKKILLRIPSIQKNEQIMSNINSYSKKQIKLLLTQESHLLIKK
jgi:protein-L-isoaspartate O-methyltransferase